MRNVGLPLALVVLAFTSSSRLTAQSRSTQSPPDIVAKWTGTWTSFNPAQATAQPKELCKRLDATVTKNGDTWTAMFEGDCGRPYTYKISLDGRLVGGVVLFKGTVDLGAKVGGVYVWVGRATSNEFIGFYTSAYATGHFNLKKTEPGE